MPGMGTQAYNQSLSTWEVETGESGVQGYTMSLRLARHTRDGPCSQDKTKTKSHTHAFLLFCFLRQGFM